MKGVSLTIPFYNEETLLEGTLESVWSFLYESKRPFEIVLGNDGSTDRSLEIAEAFRLKYPSDSQIVSNAQNRGRGSILSAAFRVSHMPIVAYMDADLEIGLPSLGELLAVLDDDSVMLCTGSKLLPGKEQARPQHRKWATTVLNILVRRFLGSRVTDHQCGLKGFQKSFVDGLLPKVREKGWAWDTEILLLAQKSGAEVEEIPVDLKSKRKSTVSILPTIAMFLRKILLFRLRGLSI